MFYHSMSPDIQECKYQIILLHGCSPVNVLHIFRTPFFKNTSGWLLLSNVSFRISTGKLFETKAYLVLKFEIYFSVSHKFNSPNSKGTIKLSFPVIASILKWFSNSLKKGSAWWNYLTVFETLMDSLIPSKSCPLSLIWVFIKNIQLLEIY